MNFKILVITIALFLSSPLTQLLAGPGTISCCGERKPSKAPQPVAPNVNSNTATSDEGQKTINDHGFVYTINGPYQKIMTFVNDKNKVIDIEIPNGYHALHTYKHPTKKNAVVIVFCTPEKKIVARPYWMLDGSPASKEETFEKTVANNWLKSHKSHNTSVYERYTESCNSTTPLPGEQPLTNPEEELEQTSFDYFEVLRLGFQPYWIHNFTVDNPAVVRNEGEKIISIIRDKKDWHLFAVTVQTSFGEISTYYFHTEQQRIFDKKPNSTLHTIYFERKGKAINTNIQGAANLHHNIVIKKRKRMSNIVFNPSKTKIAVAVRRYKKRKVQIRIYDIETGKLKKQIPTNYTNKVHLEWNFPDRLESRDEIDTQAFNV